MAGKLKKPIEIEAQNKDRTEFIEPVTTFSIVAFWFILKAAAQAVIGWAAIQLFFPIWKRTVRIWKKESDETSINPGVLEDEQSNQA